MRVGPEAESPMRLWDWRPERKKKSNPAKKANSRELVQRHGTLAVEVAARCDVLPRRVGQSTIMYLLLLLPFRDCLRSRRWAEKSKSCSVRRTCPDQSACR